MEAMGSVDLARGLIAGWMSDQVSDRGDLPRYIALAFAVLGALAILLFSGWWQVLGLVALVSGLIAALVIWVIQKVAILAIGRFAEPRHLEGHRQEFRAALDEVDLPTSPLAILRFLRRLRNGAGPEMNRISQVVSRLEATVRES